MDVEFEKLDIMNYDRFDSIEMVGNIYEMAILMNRSVWYGGMDILISKIFTNKKGKKSGVPVESAGLALETAQNYYYLRDYFWYAYNIPNSVEWKIDEKNISIKLLDYSFQLQNFLIYNNYFLKSIEVFSDYTENKTIQSLVNDCNEEFKQSKKIEEAFDLCLKEADLKINNYECFLTDDIEFHGYSVKQFKSVYIFILARALMARYFNVKYFSGDKDHRSYLLKIEREEFLNALEEASECTREIITNILNDLILDDFKISKSQGINSFPIIYNSDEDFYLFFPNCICSCNVFISLRKVWAFSNPKDYGEKIANVVSEELAKHVENTLTSNGFPYVKRGITIKKGVADIDILSIWPEKGFGNVLFFTETKNPIPESFGRDYVRNILSEDFLIKGKDQIENIKKSLQPEKLIEFLKRHFPNGKFTYGLYALKFLIITSQNIGLFFDQGETIIIDYKTFDRIVNSFNGDILHILSLLKKEELIIASKKGSKVIYKKFQIGEYEIEMPVISLENLISFGKI